MLIYKQVSTSLFRFITHLLLFKFQIIIQFQFDTVSNWPHESEDDTLCDALAGGKSHCKLKQEAELQQRMALTKGNV